MVYLNPHKTAFLDEVSVFLKNKSTSEYSASQAGPGVGAYLQEKVSPEANRQIGIWLLAVSAMLVGLVLVGGLTRLTDSGLSIVEWKPVTGMIPPLSDAAWQSYYQPMAARIEKLRAGADAELSAALDDGAAEIAAYEQVRDETGYLLSVVRPV